MTYEEMLARLLGTARFGMSLGLERMEAALAGLGSPHLRIGRVAHIAGTNGKGSTAAMLAEMMAHAGWRTGLYTSPHLARFTERVRIAGAEVARGALAERYGRLMAAAPAGLTMFEQVTLLAFMSFAEEGCEAVVLEVGLGGRLDATNVVDAEVAVVTGVALDHQEVLGGDLQAIAREKAGIFKRGRVAIIGAGGEPEAVPTLVSEARARGADARLAGCELPAEWTLALEGEHQRCNAACALAAAEVLGIPEAARRAGLAATRWPGRIERIGRVILDAAHNPQAAAALAGALEAETRPLVLLVAVSSDKDAAGVLAPLAARARAIVVTEAPSTRAMPAAELLRVAPSAEALPAWPAALARAEELAGADGLVVAFGSIFLVGALRARLLGEPVDPVAVQDPAKVVR